MIIGSSSTWRLFDGMIARPRSNSDLCTGTQQHGKITPTSHRVINYWVLSKRQQQTVMITNLTNSGSIPSLVATYTISSVTMPFFA